MRGEDTANYNQSTAISSMSNIPERVFLTHENDEQIRRVAKEILYDDQLDDFCKFYKSLDIYTRFDNDEARLLLSERFLFIRICARLFDFHLEVSKTAYSETALNLMAPGSLDLFLKLLPEAKEHVVNSYGMLSKRNTYTYLRLLYISQVVPEEVVESGKIVQTISKRLRNDTSWDTVHVEYPWLHRWLRDVSMTASYSVHGRELDFSYPSSEFFRLMIEPAAILNDFSHFEETCLMLFKIAYGESLTLEVFNTFKSQQCTIAHKHLFGVFEDWENLKHLPAAWIIETR